MVAKKASMGDFEASIKKLESIVESMERGDLSLEVAMVKFEEGVKLARECHQSLQSAEQKIKILLEKHGDLVDFEESLPDPLDNDDA